MLTLLGLSGCNLSPNSAFQNADTEATEQSEKYDTEIGITYYPGIFTGASDKTEIKVYIDGLLIDTMNRGEERIYVIKLTAGSHIIKTKRGVFDSDSCDFQVKAINDDTFILTTYAAFDYTYNSLSHTGKLEAANRFPEVSDYDYRYLDIEK